MAKKSHSVKPKKPLALIVRGAWEDKLGWAEGIPVLWRFSPQLMAELQERFAGDLEAQGYTVHALDQPTAAQLRRMLARDDVRATVFIGHGGTHKVGGRLRTVFGLNETEHIGPHNLRTWSFEDRGKPLLSPHHQGAVEAGESEGVVYQTNLETASSYNFEYSVLHFCDSLKTPDWSRALGGKTRGHKRTQYAHIMPRSEVSLTSVVMNPDFYADDPNRAIRSALCRDLAAHLRAVLGSTGPIISAPGRFETLRAALARWIELEGRYGRRAHQYLSELDIEFSLIRGAVKRSITLPKAERFLDYYDYRLKEGVGPAKPGSKPKQGATSCNGYNHHPDCRCGFGMPKSRTH